MIGSDGPGDKLFRLIGRGGGSAASRGPMSHRVMPPTYPPAHMGYPPSAILRSRSGDEVQRQSRSFKSVSAYVIDMSCVLIVVVASLCSSWRIYEHKAGGIPEQKRRCTLSLQLMTLCVMAASCPTGVPTAIHTTCTATFDTPTSSQQPWGR